MLCKGDGENPIPRDQRCRNGTCVYQGIRRNLRKKSDLHHFFSPSRTDKGLIVVKHASLHRRCLSGVVGRVGNSFEQRWHGVVLLGGGIHCSFVEPPTPLRSLLADILVRRKDHYYVFTKGKEWKRR